MYGGLDDITGVGQNLIISRTEEVKLDYIDQKHQLTFWLQSI